MTIHYSLCPVRWPYAVVFRKFTFRNRQTVESQCKCHREHSGLLKERRSVTLSVSDPSKGVCADPVNGGAILRKGGPDPQGGNKEHQLSPNKGREKT
jgi:hypothetical protein